MTQQNQHPARETNDDGTYKNSNTSGGGNNPSDYPSGDSPVTLSKGEILDEPDDPQAARPEAPYNTRDQ
jgi:hypothetical protein